MKKIHITRLIWSTNPGEGGWGVDGHFRGMGYEGIDQLTVASGTCRRTFILEITLGIRERDFEGSLAEREVLMSLVKPFAGKRDYHTRSEEKSRFVVTFTLKTKERFCDTAIEIVREVLNALGVLHLKEKLAKFEIEQSTIVLTGLMGEKWVSLADWLKKEHGLVS